MVNLGICNQVLHCDIIKALRAVFCCSLHGNYVSVFGGHPPKTDTVPHMALRNLEMFQWWFILSKVAQELPPSSITKQNRFIVVSFLVSPYAPLLRGLWRRPAFLPVFRRSGPSRLDGHVPCKSYPNTSRDRDGKVKWGGGYSGFWGGLLGTCWKLVTLHETHVFAAENGWLEDEFPFGKPYF